MQESLLTRTLRTERLTLRPMERGDTPFVVRHFTDPAVYRFMLDDEEITPEEARGIVDFYVEAAALGEGGATYNRWVIVRTADGEPLGTCGFHRWNARHRRAEVGYDLSPAFHGQGYMTEALGAALGLAFGPLGLHRVEALVAVANEPSARLLRRLGFQLEGTLRDHFYSRGQYHDHLLFALLAGAPASQAS